MDNGTESASACECVRPPPRSTKYTAVHDIRVIPQSTVPVPSFSLEFLNMCPCNSLGLYYVLGLFRISNWFPTDIVESIKISVLPYIQYPATLLEARDSIDHVGKKGCFALSICKRGNLVSLCEGGVLIPGGFWQTPACGAMTFVCEESLSRYAYCMHGSSHASKFIRSSNTPNVEIDWNTFNGVPCVKATKHINIGDELLSGYKYIEGVEQVEVDVDETTPQEDPIVSELVEMWLAAHTTEPAVSMLSASHMSAIKQYHSSTSAASAAAVAAAAAAVQRR